MDRRLGLSIAVVALLAMATACSSSTGKPTAAGSGTTADTAAPAVGDPSATTAATVGSAGDADPGWDTCRTRLDFDQVLWGIGDADPAARAAALELLHQLPTPAGLDQTWSTFVQALERGAELAQQVTETDQDKFDSALQDLAASDEQLQQLNASLTQADGQKLRNLRVDGPCDPVGMPAGFGCAEPQACTQQWLDAEASNDQATLTLLGSVRIALPSASGATLELQGCSADGSGGTRCNVTADQLQGYVVWWKTTDGRWFGIDGEMSNFVPVGSVIE